MPASLEARPARRDDVVDLTAHRGAVALGEADSRKIQDDLYAAFESEANDTLESDDAAFQITLPRGVIRLIRMRAAEEGTTHRALVLRALRLAGLEVAEGADVDRRATAAKRRQRA